MEKKEERKKEREKLEKEKEEKKGRIRQVLHSCRQFVP